MKTAASIRVLPTLFVVVALAACTPAAAQVPTPATGPATGVLPTAAPTEVPPGDASGLPSGKAFAFNGVQFTIPEGIASDISGQVVAASQGEGLPEFAINPAYTEIKLTGYPAQNAHFRGMIQVLPVADYEQISQVAGQRVRDLQALLAQKPAGPEQEIPMLPVYNAGQAFRTQVLYADFQNGRWRSPRCRR